MSSCSLLSCSVRCCGVGTPFALLASCCSSGSSVTNSSLHAAFSSKLLSLSTRCRVLLFSLSSSHHLFCILCCRLLASLLFVSMLSVLSHLVHHPSVVECTCPFWLDMHTFPIRTFFDPMVLCWADVLWMWIAVCCVCVVVIVDLLASPQ